MKFPFFIAFRYFFAKKKKNFISIISTISMLVVAIGTMSLVVALSVFNGLEDLLRNMYGNFDPDIIITPSKGKSILVDNDILNLISETEGIKGVSQVVEDNILINYKESQRVVRLKGVDQVFEKYSGLKDMIVSGEFELIKDSIRYALVGRGVQYDLSINTKDALHTMQLYYPNEIRPGVVNPQKLTRLKNILPNGVFAFEKFYDENYVFVPISFAQELFGYKNKVNAYELFLENQSDTDVIRKELKEKLGNQYTVKAGEELHADLYKVLQIEKVFVFVILIAIISIASINIFFALTMLVIEKKKDIASLFTLGATSSQVRNIFLLEGVIISLTGSLSGLVLGIGLVWLQDKFGLVGIGMETAVISSYPVELLLSDVMFVSFAIICITILASIQPSIKASKSFSTIHLQ